jgi:hypothetical protein
LRAIQHDQLSGRSNKRLERDFDSRGVEVLYFPHIRATSSSMLRRALQNIDGMANQTLAAAGRPDAARAVRSPRRKSGAAHTVRGL